jgi:hypothetical protein
VVAVLLALLRVECLLFLLGATVYRAKYVQAIALTVATTLMASAKHPAVTYQHHRGFLVCQVYQ